MKVVLRGTLTFTWGRSYPGDVTSSTSFQRIKLTNKDETKTICFLYGRSQYQITSTPLRFLPNENKFLLVDFLFLKNFFRGLLCATVLFRLASFELPMASAYFNGGRTAISPNVVRRDATISPYFTAERKS